LQHNIDTPYIQRLASFPISIAAVPLYSAYLCVSVCVLVCFSLCVVIIVFFSDYHIYLFSSLAARVFNKLTYNYGIFYYTPKPETGLINIHIKHRIITIFHLSI